ncbi:unnamed protein product [Sympodiomycopsis kandeliae]
MPPKAKKSTATSVRAAPKPQSKGKAVPKRTTKTVETPFAEDDDDSDDDDFEGIDTEDEEADIVILTPSDEEGSDDEEEEMESGDEEYDSDESDDVSEAGMARLMNALGEDGLDEDDIAALAALRGEAVDGEEKSDDDEEDGEDSDEGEEDEEDEEEDEDEESAAATGSSGSKDTLAASLLRSGLVPQQEEDDDDEEEDEDEDPEADESAIAVDSLTDAAFEALPDAVRSTRFHREKTNNKEALTAVRDAIALDPPGAKGKAKMDWIEHMSVTWDKSVQEELADQDADAEDDLKRELTIYKQALHAATIGRQRVLTAGLPFSRPDDFFAEMVKSDSHMERIRQKLLDERSSIKASEDAKRQRELKKFGKKVQVEKQLERQKNKKDLEEKIQGLKRKRGNLDTSTGEADDEFDVKIESAISSENKRNRSADNKARMPRSARDSKYGFGGKKRHSKSNTKESTEAGFGQYKGPPKKGGPGGGKGKKGGAAKRPGKSKRAGGKR